MSAHFSLFAVGTRFGYGPRFLIVFHDRELVSGRGHSAQSQDLYRNRGSRRVYHVTLSVYQGSHPAESPSRHQCIGSLESSPLDQEGGYGTATLVDTRLNDIAARRRIRIGSIIVYFGQKQDHFQKVRDIGSLLGGDIYKNRISTPFLRNKVEFG